MGVAPLALGQAKVWVMPAYVAGSGYYFPWNLGAIVEEARLIPERVSNRAGGMGTASFRWLRAWREEGAGPFYDGGYAVTGVYVAVTISGAAFALGNVTFWGFISRNDIAEIAGGNDKTGSVTALGLGYILDGTQCSGWRQGTPAGNSFTLLNCPPFNIQGDGGAIVGNKVTDSAGIPVAASLPSDCSSGALFSRLDVLNHFFNYCKPAAIPTLGLTGAAAIGTYLASAACQQVFELENLTLKGVLDLMLNRSNGLGWQVNPNASGGWDIYAYSLNDDASAYDASFPAATATHVDFSASTGAVDVSYSEDASELCDSVTVQGSRIIFGVGVSVYDANLQAGWTAGQLTTYRAGATGDAGYAALTPEQKAERNEQVRRSGSLADVFSLFTIPTNSTTPLRTSLPGNGGTTAPLIPGISWDGSTASVDDSTSRVPYLPTMLIERSVPWFVGVKGDGTDNRDATAKARPFYMVPSVFQYQASPPTGDAQWVDLSMPWKKRHGATITPDDRGPGLRIHFQPQEILAKGNFTDGTDGITKLDNAGVVGAPINADPFARTINYADLVATIGISSDQRVSVTKTRYGVPANQARRNLVVTDHRLQCWVALAGMVVGVTAAGQPDRVTQNYFIRNDFAQAERLAAMYAAWLFRKRSSLQITLAFGQLFPAWCYIGNMIGRVTESGATGPYAAVVTDSYTVIESIDYTFGDHPRATISTTIPPRPEQVQSAAGSSPTAGGSVSAALGGTVAQAANRAQGKIADLQRDTVKIPTSIGRPGISTGGAGDAIIKTGIVQNLHGFTVGTLVYYNGAWAKAKADAVATSGYAGMVTKVTDANTFDVTLAGMVSGLSGLADGSAYFLSDATAGAAIVKASLAVGAAHVPVYVATSATTAYLYATSDLSMGLERLVLGDNTTGGATFKHWFAAGKSLELQSDGTLALTDSATNKTTIKGGTLRCDFASGKYLELQQDGTLTLFQASTAKIVIDTAMKIRADYPNSNSVTIASADFLGGSGRVVKLREIDICLSGVAYKMLVLGSDAY